MQCHGASTRLAAGDANRRTSVDAGRTESALAGRLRGMPPAAGPREPSPYARRVLDVVDRIPRGQVLTYGDVREWLGESSPRAVGAVLARHGDDVPWWRVVFADGRPAPVGTEDALRRLRDEGVSVCEGRVDLRRARWDGLRS